MLQQQTKHALGSTALLTVVADTTAQATTMLEQLWTTIDTFETRFSRFRQDSELTRVNHQAGKPTAISPEFHDLLVAAQQSALSTDGLYNPFILPALQQAGYVGSWPKPQQAAADLDYADRALHNIESLSLTKTTVTIPATAALDFGGIGKGYLLDTLADMAAPRCQGFWFSLGGDLICQGFNPIGEAWRLQVQAAGHNEAAIAAVENKGGKRVAVATSGTTKRQGMANGQRWHHLIDPRTGKVAITDVLTASVRASSATLADIAASCVVLLGSQEGSNFLADKGLSGVLQLDSGTSHSENVHIVGESFILPSKERVG